MKRRNFLRNSSWMGAASLLSPAALFANTFRTGAGQPQTHSIHHETTETDNKLPLTPLPGKTIKLALVGTGIRGTSFWGRRVATTFVQQVEFIGLCDLNAGRLLFARDMMGMKCPVFPTVNDLLKSTKPDVVIVTTVDSTHDDIIIKGLEAGCDVITEKPMTTDEAKCEAILQAEKRTGKKIIVAFNYRHSPHMTKIKELLLQERVGKITSVDFHWYLNTYHGADYFRRWHAYKKFGGSLLVHKSTHHFDLVNWWLNSDPVEVKAYGSLDFYGKNGSLRGKNCRTCSHTKTCAFYWDINKDKTLKGLYADQEKFDGYLRDGCVFREDIDIYDKMSVQILYANGVVVNYSLTTYSPYEGWKIAFNGVKGRIDTWQDIPFMKNEVLDQAGKHAQEMNQNSKEADNKERIVVMDNFNKTPTYIDVPMTKAGHGGGDARMQELMFNNPQNLNPFEIMAGSRDGAMSILIGIAARKSIEENRTVRIDSLTSIKPSKDRT